MQYQIIGRIRSDFPEKFGVPKQPGLISELKAYIEFESGYGHETYLRGLEECSHIWVIFQFHLNETSKGGTVRPPLLGGEKRMGIFATRSPHRPNSIGLSLVKLEKIELYQNQLRLLISNHDFVNGTPVLDIKPYIANYDQPKEKAFHWSEKIHQPTLAVKWNESALEELKALNGLDKKTVIENILSHDPRPRQAKDETIFWMSFADLNFSFRNHGEGLVIDKVESLATCGYKKN